MKKKPMMLSSNDSIRQRMRFFSILLAPVALALIVRFYVVQVVDHEDMYKKAKQKYTATRITSGKRGEIFDVRGNLLVSNAPCFNITADPSILRDNRERIILSALAKNYLEADYQTIYRRLDPFRIITINGKKEKRSSRYAMIARNVPTDIKNTFRDRVVTNRIRGVFYEEDYMRVYPKNELLSNVIGFTSQDGSHMGLERSFDANMSSEIGSEVYERDRTGSPLSYGLHEVRDSRDGDHIYLTIDEPLQAILEEELDKAYEKWTPKTIYAIMADPKTGNILAIAQRPTFNPNDRKTITPESWRTRIVEDVMEPGSIIKPFAVAGALDDSIITPDSIIDCEDSGIWYYLRRPLRDTRPHGKIPVHEVIKTSSNIGVAKIGLMLGERRLYDIIRSFGFGQKTGLPLSPESSGILPPVNRWDGLSITRIPIGYAISVSPVQMVRAYCALADNGNLRKLRLVDRLVDSNTGEVRKQRLEPPIQLFKRKETCKEIVDMMSLVTGPGGTAKLAAIPGYRVAGKTGTSHKIERGQYVNKYFASFVGFVPAEAPAFVMLVTVDEPKGARYGGAVSAPIFRQIGERALKHLDIKPNPKLLEE